MCRGIRRMGVQVSVTRPLPAHQLSNLLVHLMSVSREALTEQGMGLRSVHGYEDSGLEAPPP